MKRPEHSPADKLRRKKAAKKINTIFGNYQKRRIGIEGVERKILEIDGVDSVHIELFYTDLRGDRQVARDQDFYATDEDLYYQGSCRMNSDDTQRLWLYCEERDARIRREKREAEAMYCVTCGSDTTDGTQIELWYTEGKNETLEKSS